MTQYVYVGEWVPYDEDEMEFRDIEEGVCGEDIITFKYKGEIFSSRILRNKP